MINIIGNSDTSLSMMTADTSTRTQKIGHGLLKQRSRRLLGNVLRKKMLRDGTHGYNDELQYNIARRGKDEDFADAIENLKAIQQKILQSRAHVQKSRPAFISPSVVSSKSRYSKRDDNANFIPPSTLPATAKSNNNFRSSIAVNGVASKNAKTSARSAISNALFQSMNFKQFVQRNDCDTKNVQQTKLLGEVSTHPKTANVPIVAANEKTARRYRKDVESASLLNGHALQFGNDVSPTRSTPDRQQNAKTPQHTTEVTQTVNIPHQRTHKRNRSDGGQTKPALAQYPTSKPAGPQFRIKTITLSGRPRDPKSDTKLSGNYVSGVSVYRPSSPATFTVNLTPIEPQNQKNASKESIFIPSLSNSTEKISGRKSHTLSLSNPVNDLNGMQPITVNSTDTDSHMRRSSEKTVSAKPHLDVQRVPSPKKEKEKTPSLNKVKECDIPRFHFPKGRPRPKGELEETMTKITDVCSRFDDRMVPIEEMDLIARACNVSVYWKGPIFHVAAGKLNGTQVSEENIKREWKRIAASNNDPSSRFVSLLAKPGKNCLDFEDFLPLLKDIVDSHPGLIFLKDAPEFHTRYMNTVIARIFYAVNRSWSGQITASELRKSNFLTVLSLLEEEDDINAITDYFSYEHFYVIYCKFWELDSDHDLVIDKHDLIGYGDGVLSSRLMDRVLCGAVTRWDTSDHHLGKMSYVDFVWFILSEEDKKTQTSIEYWFRCMDLDGDGYISMYEMEYFYEEQSQKLEQLDIEPLPFEDCVCQVFDIVNPKESGKVSLRDLKKCKMAHVFYDTFFNVAKYLNNEQKDPFVATDGTTPIVSDWDNFAAEEYEILVAEEQSSSKLSDVTNSVVEEERSDVLDDHSATATYKPRSQEEVISSEAKALVSFSKA